MNVILAVLFAAAGASGGGSAAATVGGTAKISSSSVYYDRNEGFAYFSGRVHVEDSKYQLHADRAYVFMNGTNELKRIVALGNVAMTNESKRAYGEKVSYYRDRGMVVLSAGEKGAAEVREETESGPRVVRGKKIKFWIESKQVEVVQAEIEAQAPETMNGVKKVFGR